MRRTECPFDLSRFGMVHGGVVRLLNCSSPRRESFAWKLRQMGLSMRAETFGLLGILSRSTSENGMALGGHHWEPASTGRLLQCASAETIFTWPGILISPAIDRVCDSGA